MTDTDTKPTLEERYTTAANTSNLRVEAEKGGDADIIIAAGWNQSRIGGALLRLHTEFDGTPKPRMATRDDFLLEANRKDRDARKAASRQARAFNLQEMGLQLQRMKSLPSVREQITLQLVKWGEGKSPDPVTRSDLKQGRERDAAMLKMLREEVAAVGHEDARDALQAALNTVVIAVNARRHAEHEAEFERAQMKAVEVLQWWLAQSCPECGGTKFKVAEGTGRHTAKLCEGCGGSGLKDLPQGQLGRRLANWMDQCVERARAGISRHMGNERTGRREQIELIRGCCRNILSRNPEDSAARKTLESLNSAVDKETA